MFFETKNSIRNHPSYKKAKERITKLLRLIQTANKETDMIEFFTMSTYDPWKLREDEFYNLRSDSLIYLHICIDKVYFSYWVNEFHKAKDYDTQEKWFFANAFGCQLLGKSNYEEKAQVLKETANCDAWDICHDIKFSGPFETNDEWWINIHIYIDDPFFMDYGNRERNYKHRVLLVEDLNEIKNSLTPLEFPKKSDVKTQHQETVKQSAKKQNVAAQPQPSSKPKASASQSASKQNAASYSQSTVGQTITTSQPQQNTVRRYRTPKPDFKITSCPYCNGLVRYPSSIHQRSSCTVALCPHCGEHLNLKRIS